MAKATFSVQEVAEYLDIGLNKAYELINDGVIPHVQIGKQFRIPIKCLEAWLENEATKNCKW